jgi:hypothetical protein
MREPSGNGVITGGEPWMLVPRDHVDDDSERLHLPKIPVLLAVARRGLPRIIEATVIPAILFFVVTATIGTAAAMVAVLAWGYGMILGRRLVGRPVPALLMIATLGLTVKTLVGVISGSAFFYFLQPIATTVVVGVVFFASVLLGRPFIARVAHDFCPIPPEVAGRPSVMRLFAGLTLLWATVQVLNAAGTYGMLVSLPVTTFVALKTVMSLSLSATAIAITIAWALRTAKRERLTFAVTPVTPR